MNFDGRIEWTCPSEKATSLTQLETYRRCKNRENVRMVPSRGPHRPLRNALPNGVRSPSPRA